MADVTQILSKIESGDQEASAELLPLVYEELRKLAAMRLAQEKPGQTLQATALVHDAYIRLVDVRKVQHWNSRGHFFGAAAEAIRRILLNRVRNKGRLKRGGSFQRLQLENIELALDAPDEQLMALDEAIESLEGENPECVQVVKLRFFAGLSIEEAAAAMNISVSTVKRHWTYARAWLFDSLRDDDSTATA